MAEDAVNDLGIFREGLSSGGGDSRYWVLDGATVHRLCPDLFDWYEEQLPWLSAAANRKVILSPYLQSSINLKVYKGLRSAQGWHYDTSPLSVVLFLTDSGASISIRDKNYDPWEITPETGKALIMHGREVFHRVLESNDTRVTAVMNYYYPDDCYRPPWIDRAIYENEDPPRLT